MLEHLIKRCVDINSKYCPCLLADTNHCTFCSRLQGKDFCDCNWAGVCIFYEQYWQKKQVDQKPERLEEETIFSVRKKIGEEAYWFEFELSDDFARSLEKSGSFVFLKKASDVGACYFPVGVMAVQGNKIGVVVETVGVKSTRLFQGEPEICVRGPYYNGVLGQPWVEHLKDGKVMVVAGGSGQAPATPVIQKLIENQNHIVIITAPGKIGEVFLEEALNPLQVEMHHVDSLRKRGYAMLQERIKCEPYDLLVSAGPDCQHAAVIAAVHELGMDIPMAVTNNAKMCCGEGICGSCYQMDKDGKQIKMCKAQLPFKDLMLD